VILLLLLLSGKLQQQCCIQARSPARYCLMVLKVTRNAPLRRRVRQTTTFVINMLWSNTLADSLTWATPAVSHRF
jgi:hypothetical protein